MLVDQPTGWWATCSNCGEVLKSSSYQADVERMSVARLTTSGTVTTLETGGLSASKLLTAHGLEKVQRLHGYGLVAQLA